MGRAVKEKAGKLVIEDISDAADIVISVDVIRDSFRTVAEEFGLTPENCPTHPSFLTLSQLNKLKDKGVRFFGLFLGNNQIGFIAIEKADTSLYYIEKLAVLPEYRHEGYGAKLIGYAFDYIRNYNGKRVSIAIIEEHTILKNWYKELGFEEVEKIKLPYLPFTVCFMERDIASLSASCHSGVDGNL